MRTCLPRRHCIHFATAIKYLSSTTCSQAGTRSQEFWRINHKENPDPENGNFSPYLTIEHLSNGICSDATTLLRRELLREQKRAATGIASANSGFRWSEYQLSESCRKHMSKLPQCTRSSNESRKIIRSDLILHSDLNSVETCSCVTCKRLDSFRLQKGLANCFYLISHM